MWFFCSVVQETNTCGCCWPSGAKPARPRNAPEGPRRLKRALVSLLCPVFPRTLVLFQSVVVSDLPSSLCLPSTASLRSQVFAPLSGSTCPRCAVPELWGQTAQCQTSWPAPTRGLLPSCSRPGAGAAGHGRVAGRRRSRIEWVVSLRSLEDVYRHSQKNVSCTRLASRSHTRVRGGSSPSADRRHNRQKGGPRPTATRWLASGGGRRRCFHGYQDFKTGRNSWKKGCSLWQKEPPASHSVPTPVGRRAGTYTEVWTRSVIQIRTGVQPPAPVRSYFPD